LQNLTTSFTDFVLPQRVSQLSGLTFFFIGVTITELILSELLLYSVIAVVQVVVVVAIAFGAFDVSWKEVFSLQLVTICTLQIEQHGSITLACFIYWLITVSGV